MERKVVVCVLKGTKEAKKIIMNCTDILHYGLIKLLQCSFRVISMACQERIRNTAPAF